MIGLKSQMEKVINTSYKNICQIVVMKDGNKVYESYRNNSNKENSYHVYSVTKSIVSILLGIAIDKGYIKGVSEKVNSFFPDYDIREDITIEHLITMTAPFKYKKENYEQYFLSQDILGLTLNLLGGTEKAGKFRYTPLIGPDIISGIIQKTTQKSLIEFAEENLFLPLGIKKHDSITLHSKEEHMQFCKSNDMSAWVSDSKGTNTVGWGLTLSAVDMAKIGQMYLQDGVYNGKRIVSKEWIRACKSEHSRAEQLSYGYYWWIVDKNAYAALGDGQNAIYVNEKSNIVICIASLFSSNKKDVLKLIEEYLLPVFE